MYGIVFFFISFKLTCSKNYAISVVYMSVVFEARFLNYFTENDLFILLSIFWVKMPNSDCSMLQSCRY